MTQVWAATLILGKDGDKYWITKIGTSKEEALGAALLGAAETELPDGLKFLPFIILNVMLETKEIGGSND